VYYDILLPDFVKLADFIAATPD